MERIVSKILLMLLIMSILFLNVKIGPVRASSLSISVNGDGSVSPAGSPVSTSDNVTYMLTENTSYSIVILRDNIVFNGLGCEISGSTDGNGVYLDARRNVTITDVSITGFSCGIDLEGCSNCEVIENNVTNNNWEAITLHYSNYNVVSRNEASKDISGYGIWLQESGFNTVSFNRINGNHDPGLYVDEGAHDNLFYANQIEDHSYYNWSYAIDASPYSGSNSFISNDILNNSVGMFVADGCTNNAIFHNNFNNTIVNALADRAGPNIWDDGYSSGGNFWSNYSGSDLFSGPYQNLTGSDGIGDTPNNILYTMNGNNTIVDVNNVDHYPLMKPYSPYQGQTIYIKPDGNLDPPNAPIERNGDLYTIMEDINSSSQGIVVERGNITLDGEGHALTGVLDWYSRGIDVSQQINVTVVNLKVSSFYSGIFLDNSDNSQFYQNDLTNNMRGIDLESSSDSNSFFLNNCTANNDKGLYLSNSSGNLISENNIANNGWDGICLESSATGNSVIENNVTQNGWAGILMDSSTNNTVFQNNVNNQGGNCISITSSNQNSVLENTVEQMGNSAVNLESSSGNTLSRNNVTVIEGNDVSVSFSFGNVLVQNDFVAYGRFTYGHVLTSNSTNVWDGGYPSGGNHWDGNPWSDYRGRDVFSGAYQNITGSDGIGDTPYVIDLNNIDHYPLMNDWNLPNVTVTNLTASKTIIGRGFVDLINVTYGNLGARIEAFNSSLYANASLVGSHSGMMILGNSTLTLAWNTTGLGFGNYLLTANVTTQEENNTARNNPVSATIVVTIAGDLDGDFNVTFSDSLALANTYGSTPGTARWNANADLNSNGKVELEDLVILAMHYGQHYP